MCGIVGFTGSEQAAPILLDGLKRLEYRGYDSAGIAVTNDNQINTIKASGQLVNLINKASDSDVSGLCGIGHTRWATHGAPTDTNAHPHISNDRMFAVVHNGIIENYAELRDELIEKGYHFDSETDTEVVVHLLEYYYKGNMRKALIKTVSKLEGSYALGVICSDFPDEIYTAKLGSPLIIGVGVGENFFASDATALISHTKNVIYLEDGEISRITPDKVEVFDCTSATINKTVSRIVWNIESAEKGGYEHFMLKEIMEQPKALESTIKPNIRDGKVNFDGLNDLKSNIKDFTKIVITACGSAYHAGCVGRYVIEELCRLPVQTELASELRYRNPIIDEHTLLIAISQSGETADTIAAMKECKNRGATVLSIVNVVGSTISKLSDFVIYTWAGPEIAVATTKGYITQIAILDMLALWFADNLNLIDEKLYTDLISDIHTLPERVQRALDLNPHITSLAKKCSSNNSIFFIGRNIDYAVCMEGSLKLKEISYIQSESYAAGELKHGTIALIDDSSLVVAASCQEQLFDKMMSNIKEVKTRGANVLAVALEHNSRIYKEADNVLVVPSTNPLLVAIPEIVPLQLFSYYIAKERGCDIDKPKNLAKSVTVE
ncbi:MAG: glutamine--fructose-6-phosphate transaminase (isomerizing) [Eubacteriales bacterium]|nr:glutamine--fructose-6-phosphate transaminase (isomerizing) [Eubacteriales bacterium]